MRRGEIRWVNLDPAVGSEANKVRPAVIVSNDGANGSAQQLGQGVITVVPITKNIARIYPFQAFIGASESGLPDDSKAPAEQVRSISVERIGRRVGVLSPATLRSLDEALRVQLAL
ncbi:MAG TPA: type II toxin-antitoxin system PemK/MazF family toxin [Acidimicrobiales bacterium]|jgi:mRNA interferase MazF|nr:type II toxin-antitoxin system PemK/MazF family toxin [Acidimicrobiales bacterium]